MVKPALATLWFPFLLAVLLQALFVAHGVVPVAEGGLYDTDAYMRLVRVRELAAGAPWSGAVSERSNAPMGEVLHWTRALDIPLLLGAYAFTPLLGFARALHWWGVLLSPLLQLAAIVAVAWAARPLMAERGRMWAAVIFLCQAGVLTAFMVGRPDHHGLLVLLFVLSGGLTMRLLAPAPRFAHGAWLGAVLALGLWVSVEFMAVTGLALAALGFAWLARGRVVVGPATLATLVLAGGSAIVMAVDPPRMGLLAPVYDRLSVVYLLPLTLAAAFWAGVSASARRFEGVGAPARALAGALGSAAVGVISALAFPALFGGPFVAVDPRILPIWLELVDEYRPLLAGGAPASAFLYWLGPAIPGIPYLVYRCRSGAGEGRGPWLYLAGGVALFLPLALAHVRWAPYASVLLVFPVTRLMMAALDRWDRRLAMPWRPLARAATVLLFSVGLLYLGGATRPPAQGGGADGSGRPCDLKALAAVSDGRQRILANPFFGPELLYRSGHEVVATPYHRNADGIADAHTVFSAADPARAAEVIRRRGVTRILICPASTEPLLYAREDGRESLYQALAAGRPPPWLRPVPLAPEIGAFRLFAVGAP